MMRYRRWVLVMSVLAFCVALPSTSGQTAVTASDVRRAIQRLKDAPRYERSKERSELVKLGQAAVDQLIEAVKTYRDEKDTNFIGQCILALGELKDQKATDALLDVLNSGNMMLWYWSNKALGEIWAGHGGSGAEAQKVNAALLSALYSDVPDVAVYGPALALVKINNIPIKRPEDKTADQLRDAIGQWMQANASALPPADQQPWQLNVRTALSATDDATRQQAIAALRQKRELGPIEPLLEALGKKGALPSRVRAELGQLLGELTGVPFPPASSDSPADEAAQVEQWRAQWLDVLKTHSEPRYVDYSWRGLEASLRRYRVDPNEAMAQRVKYFRTALLHQLPDPDAIPATASAKARELMTAPLEIKKVIQDAMAVLESGSDAFEKQARLRVIEDELKKKYAKEVGAIFLDRLAKVAYNEQNQRVASQLGRILTKLSGVPCELDNPNQDFRRARLDTWVDEARRFGVAVHSPH